jgi:cation diffusion facilitator family transporter
VLTSGVALGGVAGAYLGFPLLDSVAAIVISFFIFYSAYRLGRENIDYLMGKRPPKEEIASLKEVAARVKGVHGINTVRAQYAGNLIQIEIHVEVDRNISTEESHRIGKKVERALERSECVGKAFVHIDPR